MVASERVQCVVLAGGLGTRMYPFTQRTAKALLPVHDEPFAHYQLRWMQSHGVTDVLYCIGHLGEQIREAIGDGSRFGLRVDYCDEGSVLRGTGGALRLALERGQLQPSCLLTYADSFLRIDFGAVLRSLHAGTEPALLVVYRNDGRWDTSNVLLEGARVKLYDKRARDVAFTHIDYGLAAFRREVVAELPAGTSDLADFYKRLSLEGRLAARLADQRFYEIGSSAGFADFAAWVSAQQPGVP